MGIKIVLKETFRGDPAWPNPGNAVARRRAVVGDSRHAVLVVDQLVEDRRGDKTRGGGSVVWAISGPLLVPRGEEVVPLHAGFDE